MSKKLLIVVNEMYLKVKGKKKQIYFIYNNTWL